MKKTMIILIISVIVVCYCSSCNNLEYNNEISTVSDEMSGTRHENVGTDGSEASVNEDLIEESVVEESVVEESQQETSIPEIKGQVEFLDIPFEVNVIIVPVLDPLYAAGQYPWDGGIILSPEELPIGEHVKEFWEPDKGDPSYNEWIKRYTDEWFEDNWLIVLHGVEKEINLKHIGFHFEEGKQSKMLFIYDEGDLNFDWDLTYGSNAFIEIAKKDIPYDIGETYTITDENGKEFVRDVFFFMAMETKVAESNGYELPE